MCFVKACLQNGAGFFVRSALNRYTYAAYSGSALAAVVTDFFGLDLDTGVAPVFDFVGDFAFGLAFTGVGFSSTGLTITGAVGASVVGSTGPAAVGDSR